MQNYLEGLVRTLDCERVRAGAVGLLADVGMAVPSETVRNRLAEAGASALKLILGYAYELDDERQRALRKVIDDARRLLCR